MRWPILALVCLALAVSPLGAETDARLSQSLKILQSTARSVKWDASSAVSGDFTCDGVPDTVIAGYTKNRVWIGLVSSRGKEKPIIADFPAGTHQSQDGFCASPVKINKEPRNCLGEGDTPLPGCRRAKRCVAFRVYDEECDSFHFYWDSARKRLTYWRL